VARYLTPAGHDIQNLGIAPDQPLDPPEPLDPGGEGDGWLGQASGMLVARLEGRDPGRESGPESRADQLAAA
jgi:carboxyl-terminal processing protease